VDVLQRTKYKRRLIRWKKKGKKRRSNEDISAKLVIRRRRSRGKHMKCQEIYEEYLDFFGLFVTV